MGHCIIEYKNMVGMFKDYTLDTICTMAYHFIAPFKKNEATDILHFWSDSWWGTGVMGINPDENIPNEEVAKEIHQVFFDLMKFIEKKPEKVPIADLYHLLGEKKNDYRGPCMDRFNLLKNITKILFILGGQHLVGDKDYPIHELEIYGDWKDRRFEDCQVRVLILLYLCDTHLDKEAEPIDFNEIYRGPGMTWLDFKDPGIRRLFRCGFLKPALKKGKIRFGDIKDGLNARFDRVSFIDFDLKALLPTITNIENFFASGGHSRTPARE